MDFVRSYSLQYPYFNKIRWKSENFHPKFPLFQILKHFFAVSFVATHSFNITDFRIGHTSKRMRWKSANFHPKFPMHLTPAGTANNGPNAK